MAIIIVKLLYFLKVPFLHAEAHIFAVLLYCICKIKLSEETSYCEVQSELSLFALRQDSILLDAAQILCTWILFEQTVVACQTAHLLIAVGNFAVCINVTPCRCMPWITYMVCLYIDLTADMDHGGFGSWLIRTSPLISSDFGRLDHSWFGTDYVAK